MAKRARKHDGPVVVGVDLGGTNMQIGVVCWEGTPAGAGAGAGGKGAGYRILGRAKAKTQAGRGAGSVVSKIAKSIEEACSEAGVQARDLAGVGVGAPGAIDHARGIVREAPNLRWNNYPLAEELSAELGHGPVVIDNDVNVAVLGENQLGAGRQARDVLGVWVGTGIGGGLILDGRLYTGRFGSAGEIGQMVLFPGATLGNRSLEENCSRKHVARRLAQLVNANYPSILTDLADGDIAVVGASTLAEAYRRRDALTRTVVDESADLLGRAIGSCVTLLAVECVILGGGMTEAMGAPYVDRVAAGLRSTVFPDALRRVRVVATELADNAGLLGAALLARERASGE